MRPKVMGSSHPLHPSLYFEHRTLAFAACAAALQPHLRPY